MAPPRPFTTAYDLTSVDYAPQGEVNYAEPHCPVVFRPFYAISIREPRFQDLVRRLGSWMAHGKRAPCVLGVTLHKNRLHESGTLSREGDHLRLGEIGCWLSHFNAWAAIARSPWEYGTVMEDDAFISCTPGVAAHVNRAWAELQHRKVPWDVLYWCISPLPHVSQGLQACELSHWYRVPPRHCMGCVAYTIKTTVAQSWVQRAKPIRNAVDGWVAEDFGQLRVYCVKPVLGYIVPTGSDTANTANPSYLKHLPRHR